VALVGCVLLISAWAISIQYNIMVGWKKWKLTLLDGQLWLWEWRAPDEMCTGFRSYVETRDPSFHTYGLTWVKGGLCPWIGGNRRWSAPLWLPLMLGIVPTAILWYRDRRPPKGHCQACGYDLTGNVTGGVPREWGSGMIRKVLIVASSLLALGATVALLLSPYGTPPRGAWVLPP